MLKILSPLLFIYLAGCTSIPHQRTPANDHILNKLFMSAPFSIEKMPFLSHTGSGAFDNALALNFPYEPIKALRKPIEVAIGRSLEFFKSWDPLGEAHVTVITPPEISNVLSKHLTMNEIEAIAVSNKIQQSDVLVLGIGSGKKQINGVIEETFFVIVDSQNLRRIRNEVWKAYVKKGGDPKSWDPTWFFPHITIGYTKQDIHEPDVIKNIRSSWDSRFILFNQ